MVRRLTPSQARSQLRQAEQRQRQAINKYNAAVRKYNSDVKRAVDDYNRKARAHNASVRANRQRLQREVRRLSSSPSTGYVVYRSSVVTLRQSFSVIESAVEAGAWSGGDQLLDLAEGETANSVAVLNALAGESDATYSSDAVAGLGTSSLGAELAELSPDLASRWNGALYALSPRNPDAARHFCTSSREILTSILEADASDHVVLAADPHADKTPDGRVTRRARVRYHLKRRGTYDAQLEEFIEHDIDNVVTLFRDFNSAAHGSAGRFDLAQLTAIKCRVEDAIRFLHRVVC